MPRQAEIVCIFGKRGSGKSCLSRELVRPSNRLMVYNTLGEDGHNDLGLVFNNRSSLYQYVNGRDTFRAVADFKDHETLEWFLRFAHATGNCSVLIDEIDMFCSPKSVPQMIDYTCRYGRHFGVSLYVISRRPAEMPRILTSQASRFYCFRCTEPRDLEYLRKTIGDAVLTDLPALGGHDYKVYEI